MPAGVTTLKAIRDTIRQRADMVNTQFVTDAELNGWIASSLQELYDLLVTSWEDYNLAEPYEFTTDGATERYDLPEDFYKLRGLDLQVSTGRWLPLRPFALQDRGRSSMCPAASGRTLRLLYIPRLEVPTGDDDLVDGVSGWEEYVIVDCAAKCIEKQEGDPSALLARKRSMAARIEVAAAERDAGAQACVVDMTQRSMAGIHYRLVGNMLWLVEMDGGWPWGL